ncbi:MAG TPA: hypothetical protein VF194_13580 [Ferrovibrio sp.]|uniref:hypothetical protein n=1 Tax=Ferrovibrio sp. TaxID=1917215 RepID=UPI002ED0BB0B
MLRTQDAALHAIGAEGIADLCEAICLDAVDVTSAMRASIWFFNSRGDMVCQYLLDARDGRIQQGAVIPHEATLAYFRAAAQGLGSVMTEDAPAISGEEADPAKEGGEAGTQIDLLLVDGRSQPAAIFRCERGSATADDWSARDLTILRNLAQALATAIRREAREQSAGRAAKDITASGYAAGMGSCPVDLSWLPVQPGTEIRLPDMLPPDRLDITDWESALEDFDD